MLYRERSIYILFHTVFFATFRLVILHVCHQRAIGARRAGREGMYRQGAGRVWCKVVMYE